MNQIFAHGEASDILARHIATYIDLSELARSIAFTPDMPLERAWELTISKAVENSSGDSDAVLTALLADLRDVPVSHGRPPTSASV